MKKRLMTGLLAAGLMATMVPSVAMAIPETRLDPEDASDCKKGGWRFYGFKNQGQCIRFVNTGGDSRIIE